MDFPVEGKDTQGIDDDFDDKRNLKHLPLHQSSPFAEDLILNTEKRAAVKGGSDSGLEENYGTSHPSLPSCDSSLVSYCNSTEELIGHQQPGDIVESEAGSESSSVASHKVSSGGTRASRLLSSGHGTSRGSKERSLSRTTSLASRNQCGQQLVRSSSVRISEPANKPSRVRSSQSRANHQDDGRWPSTANRSHKTKEKKMMSTSMGPVEVRATLSEKNSARLRRRRSAENLLLSTSGTSFEMKPREPSLNRTASLRRKKVQEMQAAAVAASPPPLHGGVGSGGTKFPPSAGGPNSVTSSGKPKVKVKTRIYHETSIQTCLTSADVERALLGLPPVDSRSKVDVRSVSVQADSSERERFETEIKELQGRLKKITLEKENLEKAKEKLKAERDIRKQMEDRLRLLVPKCQGDIVEAIEKEQNLVREVCKNQQIELNQLQGLCCHLKKDLDKSLLTQRKIIEQQHDVEAESFEMQEFLQAEKLALADTLKDLEVELEETKKKVGSKDTEMIKLQEECSHLVRMCEQRRQENLYLESRLKAVETCSKESMLVHGAAVSGAAVALSGLSSRLEALVDSLLVTYEITSTELEDVVFHNEAYLKSHSGSENSSSGSSSENSPKISRRNGFMSAIVNAIKAATIRSTPETFSEGELLSAEPEPSVFLKDFTCNSSPGGETKRHSITSLPSLSDISPTKCSNRASLAASDLDLDTTGESMASESGLNNSQSLQNLSDAILRRQKEEESVKEITSLVVRQRNQQVGLVDQVIEVDNTITKLLKALHLIHLNRDIERAEKAQNAEQLVTGIRSDIVNLNDQLNCSSMSTRQIETLQQALNDKEAELNEFEKKHQLTQQLLTDNWHKAMSEVRRQYDCIDKTLQNVKEDSLPSPVIIKLAKELEETNVHTAATLPVSTSQPDLNANPSTNDSSKTANGSA